METIQNIYTLFLPSISCPVPAVNNKTPSTYQSYGAPDRITRHRGRDFGSELFGCPRQPTNANPPPQSPPPPVTPLPTPHSDLSLVSGNLFPFCSRHKTCSPVTVCIAELRMIRHESVLCSVFVSAAAAAAAVTATTAAATITAAAAAAAKTTSSQAGQCRQGVIKSRSDDTETGQIRNHTGSCGERYQSGGGFRPPRS